MSITRDLLEKKRGGGGTTSLSAPSSQTNGSSVTRRMLEDKGLSAPDLSAPANAASKTALQALRERPAAQTTADDGYASLRGAEDFAEKSQYRTTANGREAKLNYFTGKYTETGFDDILYDAINGNETARSHLLNTDTGRSYDLDALTADDVQMFDYLYATEGAEKAYDYLDYAAGRTYTGAEAAALGALQGTGVTSMSAAIGAGVSKLTGDKEAAERNSKWYNELTGEAAAAREQHPASYGAGSVGGNLALMYGIGGGLGAAEGSLAKGVQIGGKTVAAQLSPAVQGIVNGALTFAASDAIHNAGAAATGQITGTDLLKSVGISGVQGAAGGAAGNLVGSGLAGVLRKSGLQTPFMEFLRQTAQGFASAGANIGTGYALSEEKPTKEQVTTDLATAFLLSVLQSGISTYRTTTATRAQLEQAVEAVGEQYGRMSQGWESMTPEARAQTAENILRQTQDLRAELNGTYLAGQQTTVDQMNAALDGIEEAMQAYVSGFSAAQAATQSGPSIGGAAAAGASPAPGETAGEIVPVTQFTAREAEPEASPLPAGAAAAMGRTAQDPFAAEVRRQMLGQMETASTGEAETGLIPISEQMQESLSTGKNNIIAKTFNDIVSFVKNARSKKGGSERLYMGTMPESASAFVKSSTGVDVTGYTAILPGSSVQHIFNRHGNVQTEAARGQQAVTAEDIALIPQVLSTPDSVTLSEEADAMGRPVLLFSKQIGGTYITAQAVTDGRKALTTNTLWIQKKKNPLVTTSDADVSADPAHNVQNVPPSGSSAPTVPQGGGEVNYAEALQRAGAGAETAEMAAYFLERAAQGMELTADQTAFITSVPGGEVLLEQLQAVREGFPGREGLGPKETENGGQRAAETPAGAKIAADAAELMDGGMNRGEYAEIAGGEPSAAVQGDAISDGGQGRFPGAGTGEQTGELAAGPARAVPPAEQGRTAVGRQNRGKHLRATKVSSMELGLANGTETPSVSLVAEADWDEGLRATAERVRQETGLAVTYVLGSIPVRDAGGVVRNVRGVYTADQIILQADNLRVTTDQIADHEIFHDKAFQTPGLVRDVELRIMEQFTPEEFAGVVQTYVEKLRGVVDVPANATPDEIDEALAVIKEEIMADAYAGINAFSAHAERFQGAVEETLEEKGIGRETAAATDRTTGPPDRYSYGGKNANRADSESQREAETLEMQGVDQETIREQTGWFRGADGKWRFEIDDSGMVYHDRSGGVPGQTLADYLTHDELFANYPQLRKTKLEFAELGRGIQGQYDAGTDTITLNEALRDAPEGTLIHEIQHAIQRAEGFARGANDKFWSRQLESGYDGRTQEQRRETQRLRQEYNSIREQDPAFFRDMLELSALVPDMPRGKVDFDTLEQIEEDPPEWQRYDEARAAMEEKYSETRIWDFDDLLYRLKQAELTPGRTGTELYYDTAGEIEARDAARRRTLTAEERRARRPDIGNEDTVFAEDTEDDGWYAASYDAETSSIKEQIAASQERLSKMDVVASAKVPTDLPNKDTAAKWAAERLKSTGYKVDRQGYGEIYFSKKDIDKGLRYADTPEEKAALAVLPQVLKRGIEIGGHGQHKGRTKQTVTFAAPVELNGTRGNMAVVVNRHGSHYYAHRIVLPDGTAFRFTDEQNNAARELSRGVTVSGSLADTTGAASDRSITQNIQERKGENSEPAGLSLPTLEEGLTRFSVDESPDTAEQEDREQPAAAEGKKRRQRAKKPVAEHSQGVRRTRNAAQPRTVAQSLPIIAKRDLKSNLLNLFSIPAGQKAELGGIIDQYAERLLKNGELTQADRDAFFDRMYAAGVMTMPADEYYATGREAVKGGKVYVTESEKHEFGDDWNEFRKRAFANGIYLTSSREDRGVDQWNMELAETLPGLFDAGELDSRSVLERIVQVAEEGKDQKLSLAEYAAELAGQEYISEDEILDNMERQMDWALRTFAEKAQLEIHLRDRTGVKIAQEREKFSEATKQQRERDMVRRAEERAERKAMQQRQREHRELRELQERTLKQLQWLSKNRWRAPEELRAAFDEVLGDIDIYAIGAANEMNWSRKYEATWKDLAQLYKTARETDPNFLPSKELEKIVARLDGDKIADLDVDALQDLYRAAVGLRTEFYNRNNVVGDELNRLFEEVYADSKREIETAAGGYKGKGLDKFLNLEQLTPMNVLERMGGWTPDGTFYSMAKQLEEGERSVRDYTVRAKRRLESFLTEHEDWVKKADGQGKDAVWYELEVPELLELGMGDKPIFGKTITVYMTPAQKVHLYLESKNYDNLRHMTGGRTFANRELYSQGKRQEALAQGTTIRLAPETVKKIVSDLTDEEMELAQVLEKYYNDFAKGEINRVANILYGYDKAQSRDYAPIFTNQNYTKSEIGIFDTTAEGVGHLKARQFSKNPSYNISAFDAFERHVDQTARFVGMSIPARNWQTLLNWREKNNSMGDVITHKWGEEGKKYIEDLLNELQGGNITKRSSAERLMDTVLSNYISSVFGFNPSIVFKQAMSFPLAGTYLGWENIPNIAAALRTDDGLINTYTSELAYRLMGYATPETAQLKNNPSAVSENKVLKFTFGGGAITAMDGWTVKTIWRWAENKVRRDMPELETGTAEQIAAGQSPFYQEVAKSFEEAVSRSQPMYDVMHRAEIMRNSSKAVRAITLFKTVPIQQYNMLRQTVGEAQQAKRDFEAGKSTEEDFRAARGKAGRAVLSVILAAVGIEAINFLAAMLKNKGKQYRDEDGDLTWESAGLEFLQGFARDNLGMVAGMDAIAEFIGAALTGDSWYGIETPGITQIEAVLEGGKDAAGEIGTLVQDAYDILFNGGDLGEYFRRHGADYLGYLDDALETVAAYFGGFPAGNIKAYVLGSLRWISPEFTTAYEDALSTADKAGLAGLTGGALETRVGDILHNRLGETAEGTAAELAALYEAGYKKAVPTDTPASVTVNGEDQKLSAYQQQTYDAVWRESVAGALDELLSQDWYTALDSGSREKVLAKLYDYGAQNAKAALFDEFEADSFVEKIRDFRAAGLSTVDYLEAWRKSAEIDDSGANASGRATEFAYWADTQGYTAQQAEVVKNSFTVFSHLPVEPERYTKLQAAGLSDGEAKELTEALAALEPLDGAASVSDMQRLRTIAAAGLDTETMKAAMGTILGTAMATESGGKSQYALMLEALDAGYTVDEWLELKEAGYMTESAFDKVRISGRYDISPAQYIRYRELLLTADALNEDPDKRNGSVDQDETAAAINGMLGLTDEQKAVLWQLQNKSWKANKNPFDSAVGQTVYDYLHEEELPSLTDGGLPSLSLPSLDD